MVWVGVTLLILRQDDGTMIELVYTVYPTTSGPLATNTTDTRNDFYKHLLFLSK